MSATRMASPGPGKPFFAYRWNRGIQVIIPRQRFGIRVYTLVRLLMIDYYQWQKFNQQAYIDVRVLDSHPFKKTSRATFAPSNGISN